MSCNVHNGDMVVRFGGLIFTFCCSIFVPFHGNGTCSIWHVHDKNFKNVETSKSKLFKTPKIMRNGHLEAENDQIQISKNPWFSSCNFWSSTGLVLTNSTQTHSWKNNQKIEISKWRNFGSICSIPERLGVLKSADFEVFDFLKISTCTCHMLHVPCPWK